MKCTRTACLLLSLCTLTGFGMWQGMLFQDCMLHPEGPEWSAARLLAWLWMYATLKLQRYFKLHRSRRAPTRAPGLDISAGACALTLASAFRALTISAGHLCSSAGINSLCCSARTDNLC